MIVSNIKKKLEARKDRWASDMHNLLWAYKTTPRTATRESSFSLTYGVEAVVPTEVQVPSLRFGLSLPNQKNNDQSLKDALDDLEEKMEET